MYCNYCGKTIPEDANLCAYCGRRVGVIVAPRKRLVRSGTNRKIAGVCAGLADYVHMNVTLMRLLWAVVAVLSGIVPVIIAYLLAWIIMSEVRDVAPVTGSGAFGAAPTPTTTAQPSLAQERVDPEVGRIRAAHPELVGVRGWLGWFCIITAIILPAIVLLGALAEPSEYSIVDLGLAAFSVLTGIAIWKLWPQALKLTNILLATQFAVGVILVSSQILKSSNAVASNVSPDATGARALVGSIIWFSYFKKSRRVKATFGRNI